MKIELKELMDNIGVGYMLSAYETCPWSAYDDEKEISCNAEVRMNNDASEMEAEIQLIRDNPAADEKPVEQVCWMCAKPSVGSQWEIKIARVKEENKTADVYAWEDKAVQFFHSCVQELKLGKIPDIDEIYEREMKKKDRFGDNSQGGGGKSPKIKPQALLGMKGGRM